MNERPIVLLTNDDGIGAAGLLALERAFAGQDGVETWTVAPARGQSTTSHGMTLYRPVFVEEMCERRFAVEALPSDCVYLALFGLLPRMPAVVLSGINRGANLGQDVIYSGTVAAAREAVVRGVHGIAASLVHGSSYEAAARSARDVTLAVLACSSPSPLLLNLNYPEGEFQGPQLAPLGQRRYPWVVDRRVSPGGSAYYWLGGPAVLDEEVPGSDGWLVGRGIASATPLQLDQTLHSSCAPGSLVDDLLRGL
ncbi:MAG: 5'/3'-nucleotidase SurE [Myxococcota bacterium]|nr:5'/3'-nucleotidase SurE [Myxococcota bacterium]